MDKSDFLKVLHKYLNGDATHEERLFLYTYYNLFEGEPDIVELWNKDQKDRLKNQMQTAIWENINSHEIQDKNIRPIYQLWITRLAIVASILAVCMIGFFLTKGTAETKPPAAQPRKSKEHSVILLPDGSTKKEKAEIKISENYQQ
jgi:transmembrane sensor